MSKLVKINRSQKLFLKGMKEKLAEDPNPTSWTKGPTPGFQPEPIYEPCPVCGGHGFRKGSFCHHCGGRGKRKIRTRS